MLLNEGKHPFYLKNINKEQYIDIMKNKELTLNCNKLDWLISKLRIIFNRMATDLIQKLLAYEASKRYSSGLALEHPWLLNTEDFCKK